MKKLFSLLACCAMLGFFTGCGCCKKSSKKSPKKEIKHKSAKHKDVKHKNVKHDDVKKVAPAKAKKGYLQRAEDEVEYLWDEMRGLPKAAPKRK